MDKEKHRWPVPGPATLAAMIESELRARGDPARAAGARRYLKSALEFIGVTAPVLRKTVREALRRGAPDRVVLLSLVELLWARDVFELKAAAMVALVERGRLLRAEDMALVERLIRQGRTWALVDGLAIWVAGDLAARFPELGATLDRWAADGDFWVRRVALLALLAPLRRGGGDFPRFARYADPMLEEREFFIRKAIGWVLREVGKKRPQLVVDWLAPRLNRASGLTVREAVRHLPPELRDALLAARERAKNK